MLSLLSFASQVTEFDTGVKWVKVNLDSSFEQITMGHSSQCSFSFKAIILLVPEKKIFDDCLLYMIMVAILVMWLEPIEQNFNSSNPYKIGL